MSSAAPKQKGMREYRKTGLFTLKRALIDLGSRAIDGRSKVMIPAIRIGLEVNLELRKSPQKGLRKQLFVCLFDSQSAVLQIVLGRFPCR